MSRLDIVEAIKKARELGRFDRFCELVRLWIADEKKKANNEGEEASSKIWKQAMAQVQKEEQEEK